MGFFVCEDVHYCVGMESMLVHIIDQKRKAWNLDSCQIHIWDVNSGPRASSLGDPFEGCKCSGDMLAVASFGVSIVPVSGIVKD